MQNKIFFVLLTTCFSENILAQVSKLHAKVNLNKNGDTITGKVHINGNQYELNLKSPDDSIFSSEFDLTIPKPGPRGGIILQKVTPSKEQMAEIESSIYVDSDANAAFKVRNVNGDIQLHGIMDNFHISHDGEKHFAVSHETEKPIIADYVTFNSTLTYNGESVQTRQRPLFTEPELLIFVDYAIYNNVLRRNNDLVVDYLQVLVRAVNNRYAVTSDPIVRFKIIGAVVMSERNYQPFIEESKLNDGSYHINNALEKFGDYMYRYRDYYQKHDLAPLLSGENWKGNTNEGLSGIAGIAWLRGACNDGDHWKSSKKTQISQDKGGFWQGTYTFAHELAHNLNVLHDGDSNSWGDASQCPWSEGYIMSYDGWGKPNKFRFSSCSRRLIAEFLRSDQSDCLKRNAASSSWAPANQDAGDRLSMDTQCKAHLNRRDARVDTSKSPDELCTNLSCIYKDRCGWGDNCDWYSTLNYAAFDNSPCGNNGGRCQNGRCIRR